MSQTDNLLQVIEILAEEDGLVDREELRDACAMLEIFPAYRFRQCFYQNMQRLAARGLIRLDGDMAVLVARETVKFSDER